MQYLTQRKGNFYLRLPVPKSLQTHLKQVEIFHSLNTTNRTEAKYLALHLSSKLLVHFERLKLMVSQPKAPPTVDDVLQSLTEGRTSEFESRFNPKTGDIGFKTDPGLTGEALKADMAAGMEWQEQTIAKHPEVFSNVISTLPQNTAEEAKAEREALREAILGGVKSKNIHSAVDDFLVYIEVEEKLTSVRHYKDALEHFKKWITGFHPNISVHKITFEHCRDYKKVLEQLPNHKKKGHTIGFTTVNKRMLFLQKFFKWCQLREQGYLRKGEEHLPTSELIKKVDYNKLQTSYVAFTQAELEKIFDIKNWKFPLKTPYGFWLPLLGLFTGASTGELLMLRPVNINNHNNEDVWTIYIDDRSKNLNSKRSIPIHQAILDLGFLEYVEDIKRLFTPDHMAILDQYCQNHTCYSVNTIFPFPVDLDKQGGKTFRQLLIRLGIKNPKKVFHSFSKTVSVRLASTSLLPKFQEHYIGHLPWSVHKDIYADNQMPITHYKEQLDTHLKYKLDLSAFKYKSGMFDEFFKEQLKDLERYKKFGHK